MPLLDLHHVAVKTADLDATERFYVDVLGMRKVTRPDFDFPGAWLQMGSTMFHFMAGWAALDDDGKFRPGGAAVHHIALEARGFDDMKARLKEFGLPVSENDIPVPGIWQLFVQDPNGLTIEMNFDTGQEPEGSRGPEGRTVDI